MTSERLREILAAHQLWLNSNHLLGARADFTGADLRDANLIGKKLCHAVFVTADLTGADLSGADLRRASFGGAMLTSACLDYTDLTGADLVGASLRSASLAHARLGSAPLLGADLGGVQLLDTYVSPAQARYILRNFGPPNLDYKEGRLSPGRRCVLVDRRIY
jgi:uncharacterized protein YjbI with pentapeptide repeats